MTKDEEAFDSGFIFLLLFRSSVSTCYASTTTKAKTVRKRTNGLKPTVLFLCHIKAGKMVEMRHV
ncbi:hypothetical protein B4144_2464 [Bacillus atrophaeus]|nr:hypothetical protein B4144_2464 [Bacillus atrophaeus]